MNFQDAGIGAGVMGIIGLIKTYFNSESRRRLSEMKIEAKVKAAADNYISKVTIEYDQKIKNVLEKVVMLTDTVARQTETIKHLESTLENIANDFRMVVAISKEHIKDKSIIEIVDKIGKNTNQQIEKIKESKKLKAI
jgi:hypothetical protein